MPTSIWNAPRARFVCAIAAITLASDASGYRTEIEAFRENREHELKADDGWLTLIGLYWLKDGETSIGADPACDVTLPPGAPSRIGVLTLDRGKASLSIEPGASVTLNSKPFTGGAIRTDAGGGPDILAIGTVRIILIERGARKALRIKDNASPDRRAFSGLSWFEIDESWRISAQFKPYAVPKSVTYETIVGEPQSLKCPGVVVFERGGVEFRLEPVQEGERLWFVFRDQTSGKTTHANARQLYADPPDQKGNVTLDFNKAMNLPCASRAMPHVRCRRRAIDSSSPSLRARKSTSRAAR